VVRTEPKGFFQRQPDGQGGFVNNLKGIALTLYHQNELTEAKKAGKPIYFVEGEKDADRLRGLGLASTTNPMGAGKWRTSFTEVLHGAVLVIIPDNDSAGRDHANLVAKACYGRAASIRILDLPGEDKDDASDWLDHGGTVGQMEQLLAQVPEYEPPPDATLPEIIVTDRHLRYQTADALAALYKSNNPERIFRRSAMLTRVSLDEQGSPFTEKLDEAPLRGELARSCNFVRITSKNDKAAVAPPLYVVRDVASLGALKFPALLGITEAPVIRPDGTLFTEPGYDSSTDLFYFPDPKLAVPTIPDKPSTAELKSAIELVLDPMADFPFNSDASRANALGTMFTPVLRPMIDGPVPMALFDKPQQGTGAGLLSEVISLIATGRAAAMMAAPKDDESWRKLITSILIRGQLVATIDNIEQTLAPASLAAVLTSTTWQDRILGKSELVTLPNRVTWIGTGNNIKLGIDMPRRCIWIKMDALMARPWQRGGWKHPRLREWVMENRGRLLAAILTIARAWAVAGMPAPENLPFLGGFEDYCRVVGGVMAFIGVGGFLGNLEAMYDETDVETPQWEVFLETWHETIGERVMTAGELKIYLTDSEDLRATLPDKIGDILAHNYTVILGQHLGKKNGVRYPNGLLLTKAGKKQRAVAWKVARFDSPTSPQLALEVRLNEVVSTPALYEKKTSNNNVYGGRGELTSPNLTTGTKKGEVDGENAPVYPNKPCYSCGNKDFYLSKDNRWLCPRCHPEPPEKGE